MIKINNEEMKIIFNDAMKCGEYGRADYLKNVYIAKLKNIKVDGFWDLIPEVLTETLKDKETNNNNFLKKYSCYMFYYFYDAISDEEEKKGMLELYNQFKKNNIYSINSINDFIIKLDKYQEDYNIKKYKKLN